MVNNIFLKRNIIYNGLRIQHKLKNLLSNLLDKNTKIKGYNK